MLGFVLSADAKAILGAISRSQAIIEFRLDGTIIDANANFCRALGYDAAEIMGRNHRMFVDPAEAASPAYSEFWKKLGRGEFDQRQYKRIGKGGREIWIEASYNPVMSGGKPYKVVKFATDITEQKRVDAENAGKLAAISKAQAIIEFSPQGKVEAANENFLRTFGYQLEEILRKPHSLFCDPAYTASNDYEAFWSKLGRGEFISDEFMRIGKDGNPIHIQASYNPIFDPDGKVFKIVKFATDISARVDNVNQLGLSLKSLAEGDLTQTVEEPFIPALDQLRRDFNDVSLKLRTAMLTVRENAGAIAAASQEIQAAANDLSRRTEQQAASVEETAAALEQITTTVSDSSRQAEEAGLLVRETKVNAEHSGSVVREAVDAMARIEQSASAIATIIMVIDGIAFQTNLLALNAGVEAARAGDAGKGFAVVAQEVRELAQRSAKAAKEIKDLINTSNRHVRTGVTLVGNTGHALEQIVAQVVKVDGNVAMIVDASREQATGLSEINLAVSSIDQGTQQNAAMVEQTTASASSLALEAEKLFSLLSQFNLGRDQAPLGGDLRQHGGGRQRTTSSRLKHSTAA